MLCEPDAPVICRGTRPASLSVGWQCPAARDGCRAGARTPSQLAEVEMDRTVTFAPEDDLDGGPAADETVRFDAAAHDDRPDRALASQSAQNHHSEPGNRTITALRFAHPSSRQERLQNGGVRGAG